MDIKPKILIVHNYYKISGGEDTVVKNEKELLEKNGHQVVLYTRNNRELDKFGFFRKLFLPLTAVFNFKSYFDVKRIIKKEKIDILHVHNTLSLISPSVYYAGLKRKIPVVQTIHNFRLLCPKGTMYKEGEICEDCVKFGLKCAVKNRCYRNSKLQSRILKFIIKFHRFKGIYKKINYICLTDFNKQKLLEQKQIKENQIFVKPNFCANGKKAIPFSERQNQFVFVGRLDESKGIKFLLDCFSKTDKKLKIYGEGDLSQYVKDFIADRGLKNVEYLGKVDHEKAMDIMANSKALILPTEWYEGFPMTVVEAFFVGTPVICPDMGNCGNLITEGVNGYKYKGKDAGSFLSALDRVGDIVDSIKKSAEKYGEKENYDMLLGIYNSLI